MARATLKGVYYEGRGSFAVRAAPAVPPGPGEVRLEVAYCGVCGTDLHIAHGAMDQRVNVPQVIGHEMSGNVAEIGEGVEGFEIGDAVVVRPLDTRGETRGRQGVQPHQPQPEVPRHRRSRRVSALVDGSGLHAAPAAAGVDLQPRGARRAARRRLPRRPARRARPRARSAVVIGGGPIGLLIALVARALGARVLVSRARTRRGARSPRSSGSTAFDPGADDVAERCRARRPTAPAPTSSSRSPGSAAGVLADDGARLRLRGRVVVVAIFPEPQPVALFDFFWKELELRGARVYEPEDFERAIELLAAGSLAARAADHRRRAARTAPGSLRRAARRLGSAMKILVDCRA